jgi:exopolysaccharide biosynthesis polyprenyl glycosylphosphotransferase
LILLVVLWSARIVVGYHDPSVALGTAALFIALTGTRAVPDRLQAPIFEDLKVVAHRTTMAFAVVAALVTLTSTGDLTLLLYTLTAATAALALGRLGARAVESRMRKRGAMTNTLVLGAGAVARQIIHASQEREGYGLNIIGAVDDDPRYASGELGVEVLGALRDAQRLIRERDIRTLIVAFSNTNPGEMVRIIRDAQAHGIAVWIVPRFFELGRAGGADELLWGVPLMRLTPPAPQQPQWQFKRALDVVLAGAAMIAAAPVAALCGLAVLVESGRPILHRQRRVSRDGREFTILKFRTMRPVDSTVEGTEWGADPMRITRVGSWLRDKSLDELPQLYNVLKGDMSLVGPRPERPHFVDRFGEEHRHYNDRHRVPAGLTGWAQIHGLRGDDTPMEDRIVFDNNYIDSWSISEDVRIMARTIKTFMGQGK